MKNLILSVTMVMVLSVAQGQKNMGLQNFKSISQL